MNTFIFTYEFKNHHLFMIFLPTLKATKKVSPLTTWEEANRVQETPMQENHSYPDHFVDGL